MFSECAELAIFLYVFFAIFWYLRKKQTDLDKIYQGLGGGKVRGGGRGVTEHESYLSFQVWEASLYFFFSGALSKFMKSIMWIIVLNVRVSVVLMQIYEGKTIDFLFLVMFCLPDPFTLCMQSKETKECLTNCFPQLYTNHKETVTLP